MGSKSAFLPRHPRPTLLCAGGLVLLAACVYGPHVLQGGFYWDDWQLAARDRFPVELPGAEVRGVFDLELLAYRPLMGVLLPAVHATLGADPQLHLLVAQVIGVGISLIAFMVLRELGLGAWPAAAVAALALVFPWGDSVRLWATPALNGVALLAYLAGVLCALRALRGRRRGLVVTAPALYAAGTLLYEAVAPAALLSFLLYRTVAPWGPALRRGTLDWAAVGLALVLVARNTPREMQPLQGALDHALVIADQALTIAARAVLPVAGVPRGVGLALLAGLVVAGAVVARGMRDGEPRRALGAPEHGRGDTAAVALRHAGLLGAGAVVGIVCAYGAYVPAAGRYQPLAAGVGNRVGLLAALAYAALVVAGATAAGVLAARALRRPGAAPLASALLVIAAGVGWSVQTAGHAREWDRAAGLQDSVLEAIRSAVPKPPREAVIYTTGAPIYAAQGVPVFSVTWDLRSAVRLHYDRRDLRAYALPLGRGLICAPAEAFPAARAYGPSQGVTYGRAAIVVDVPSASAIPLSSRRVCRRVNARLLAGDRATDPGGVGRSAAARGTAAASCRRCG